MSLDLAALKQQLQGYKQQKENTANAYHQLCGAVVLLEGQIQLVERNLEKEKEDGEADNKAEEESPKE